MKLNPDCIRDILLTVEEITSPSTQMFYQRPETTYDNFLYDDSEIDTDSKINYEKLKPYTDEDILYHINQCELSGFFTEISWVSAGCFIEDLSPIGHEFLANIRTDTNWNKTKDVAKKIGSTSLSTLKDISAQVIAELLKNAF